MGSREVARYGRRGLVLALLAGGIFAFVLPSAALAFPTGVGMFDDTSPATNFRNITYTAAVGQANNVSVTLVGTNYIVTDSGAATVADADGPGVGCEQNPLKPNEVSCPDPNAKSYCWGTDPNIAEFFDPNARIVRRIQVWGNDGDDTVTLDNSVSADLFFSGGQGNDHVNPHRCDSFAYGGPGDDYLDGGGGTDILQGEGGNDEIHPGTGNDYDVFGRFQGANGGPGDDTLSYSERTAPGEFVSIDTASNDSLQGTAGTTGGPCRIGRGSPGFVEFDTMAVTPTEQFELYVGTSGDDCIRGTRWAQSFRGGPGRDQISGGQGIDTVEYSDKTSAVTVSIGDDPEGGPGNDGVGDGTAGNTEGDNIYSDVENVTGGPGNDTLIGEDRVPAYYDPAGGYLSRSGQEGAGTLNGAGGDDVLDGKQDADTLIGGPGVDTVTYAARTSPIQGTIGDDQTDDGDETDVNTLTSRGDNIEGTVEQVIGGPANDVLRGNGLDNRLLGNGGSDLINGGDGNDDIQGGDGDDLSLEGAAGNDSIAGGAGNDDLEGGDGTDALDGGDGDDLLDGNTGPDTLTGGPGGDAADYTARLRPVTASADGIANDGETDTDDANPGNQPEGDNVGTDVEDLYGGIDDDVLVGNGDLGFLDGGAGDDVLDGGGGPDDLFGGPGADRVTYQNRSGPVTVDLTTFGGDGEAGEDDDIADDVEKVTGSPGNDTIVGDGASNMFFGGGGNDTIDGGGGFDLLHGDGGNDKVDGAGGTDQVFGDDGNDTLLGGTEADTLSGGVGDDSLDGGTATDTLNGNAGNDTANYAARTNAVNVTLDGTPNDGQSSENDLVKSDVESVSTGSGNDTIDSADGVAGKVSCGRGTNDTVSGKDTADEISDDCENVVAAATRLCTMRALSGGKMSRSGVVRIRVNCPTAGRTALTFRKGRSKVGSKRFSVRAGKVKTVKVKLSRKGRRAINGARRNRLRLKVTLSTIRAGGKKVGSGRTQTFTIKAPRGK